MKNPIISLNLAVFAAITATPAMATVTIDYVFVGDAGNANDTTGYGSVASDFQISKNETTISQYAEFLNAAATTDSYGLYNSNMGSDANISGISRSGSSGSYTYSVLAGSGNHPIAYVSWFDAARFCNWMQNGQGSGSTETGAYTLAGATSGVILKNVGATIHLPNQDQWYKSAYYDPNKGGAGVGGYWAQAMRTDTLMNNTVSGNYNDGDYAVTQSADYSFSQNYLTDVGAYGLSAASAYGTNDQGGNVWEWNDAVISGSSRGMRGGAWKWPDYGLPSSLLGSPLPTDEGNYLGFRVTSVPEPSCLVLTLLASGAMFTRRKRSFLITSRSDGRQSVLSMRGQ
jgi:formylglycine-generating enzyme